MWFSGSLSHAGLHCQTGLEATQEENAQLSEYIDMKAKLIHNRFKRTVTVFETLPALQISGRYIFWRYLVGNLETLKT